MSKAPSLPPAARWFLLFSAFLTGAVVMALEIVGSRLLAPIFGNSLFVWGALIGVILAAMSTGYAFGGWSADRYSVGTVLTLLLLGAGSWTLMISWLGQPVIYRVSTVIDDPRWGPCAAASLLLAPPAFGLSAVLPALLRLAVVDLGYLGRRSGGMIALSTVGSLLGTWGTAFFLLSWLGTKALVAVLGCLQILLGLAWLWTTATTGVRLGGSIAVGLLLLGWQVTVPAETAVPGVVHQEESPYQQVRVRDDDLFRYLVLDRTWHAVMWRSDPVTLFLPYSQLMVAALAYTPESKRGLILGHGGGSIAKWLAEYRPQLELDVVEFDPVVIEMAEQHFGYRPPSNHQVFAKDARAFLRTTSTTYDVIWVDAFARHLIPFHLTTTEFFAELRHHLTPSGVVAVNLASSGHGGDRLREAAVVETMRTAFPVIETYAVKGPWRTTQTDAVNLIFFGGSPVASLAFDEFAARVTSDVERRRLPPQALTLLATRRIEGWPIGLRLTDDFAPYDLLMGSPRVSMHP